MVESEEDLREMLTSSPTSEMQLEEEKGKEHTKEGDEESNIHSLGGEHDKDGLKNAMESLPPQDFEDEDNQSFTGQKLTLEGAESARSCGDMEVISNQEEPQEMEFIMADDPEDSGIPGTDEQLPKPQRMDTSDLIAQIPTTDMHSDVEDNFHQYSEGDSNFPHATQLPPAEQNITDDLCGLEGCIAMELSDSEVPKPKHITVDQYPIAQCQRLYGCIQAAASRLEDATKDRSTQRVSCLTKLIPRDPVEHIGK